MRKLLVDLYYMMNFYCLRYFFTSLQLGQLKLTKSYYDHSTWKLNKILRNSNKLNLFYRCQPLQIAQNITSHNFHHNKNHLQLNFHFNSTHQFYNRTFWTSYPSRAIFGHLSHFGDLAKLNIHVQIIQTHIKQEDR